MISDPTPDLVHSFSYPIAKKYGVNAAIVLGYLGRKIAKSAHLHDSRHWYYTTYRELAENYPYLGLTAVYEAVQRLVADSGPLLHGNYNRWKQDKTCWYAFREEHYRNQLDAEPRYFKVSDASAYGVTEAVILNNFAHWIGKNQAGDPNRIYHPASAQKLSQILPFSRSSIQRALDSLVNQRVLVMRVPEDRRKPNEYALASLVELQNTCPNTNKLAQSVFVSEQQPKNDGYPKAKMPGPTTNTGGPDTNMGSPNANTGGPTTNNITYLKDIYCEDYHLKDICLKEDRFKAASQVGASSAHIDFVDSSGPLADSIACSLTANQNDVAASEPTRSISVAPPSKPLNLPESLKAREWPVGDPNNPRYGFLDPDVHYACWDVMLLHGNSQDEMIVGMGLGIVEAIKKLIEVTEPSRIDQLMGLPSQLELNAALVEWAADFLSQYYDEKFSINSESHDQDFRREFVRQGICFLNMSFHKSRFDMPSVYFGSPLYGEIIVAIYRRMRPYQEKQGEERRQRYLNERRAEYASPDQHKENDPSLTAAEKMQVFNQSLQARNRIGRFDELGQFTEMVVLIHRNTMNLVRQFFQLNPEFTPAHLNQVIDQCLELGPTIADREDAQWYAKQGHKISFLVTNLSMIAAQLNLTSSLPAITPLPHQEKTAALEMAA